MRILLYWKCLMLSYDILLLSRCDCDPISRISGNVYNSLRLQNTDCYERMCDLLTDIYCIIRKESWFILSLVLKKFGINQCLIIQSLTLISDQGWYGCWYSWVCYLVCPSDCNSSNVSECHQLRLCRSSQLVLWPGDMSTVTWHQCWRPMWSPVTRDIVIVAGSWYETQPQDGHRGHSPHCSQDVH